MANRRSPLREPPLRTAGQSLQELIDRVQGEEIDQYAALATAAICLAAFEWVAWFMHSPRQPLAICLVSAVVVVYSLLRIRWARMRLRALKLGRDGERAVADALDKLKTTGAVVLHDIVGDGFNVDHVVLGRKGIYAVETKTLSKPSGGEVTYDGKELKLAGFWPLGDPVGEVLAVASWLQRILKEMTGKHERVRPVVVFPGWYVRNQGAPERPDVWVLNPEQLPAIIDTQPQSLSEDDLRAAVFFLTRFIKTRANAA